MEIEDPWLSTGRDGAPASVAARAAAGIETFFLGFKVKFYVIHIIMLAALLVLMIVPAALPLPSDDDTVFTSFTLFARYLIWGLWFPLALVSVIPFGRAWCGLLCPQGAISEYASKIGLNRALPGWIRLGWVPVLSFVLITLFGQVVGVRDYPLPAMEVFIGTTLLAVLIGFLYGGRDRRVWCRYLCPMGPLLGLLSRLGVVSFDKNGSSARGRGTLCPTFINTTAKTSCQNCIECFKCVEPEDPGSLHLRLRRPGVEVERIHESEPNIWEVVFIFVATGLAFGSFYWQATPLFIDYKQALGSIFLDLGLGDLIGSSGPWYLIVNYPAAGEVFIWLDFIAISTFMLGSMVVVTLALFAFTALSALISGVSGHEETFAEAVVRLGYLYAPVALVSLVLGLGLMLFGSLGSLGISASAIRALEIGFLLLGAAWSVFLASRLNRGPRAALVPSVAGVFAVAYLWYSVLF